MRLEDLEDAHFKSTPLRFDSLHCLTSDLLEVDREHLGCQRRPRREAKRLYLPVGT